MRDALGPLLTLDLDPKYRALVLAVHRDESLLAIGQALEALPSYPTPRSPDEAALWACWEALEGRDPSLPVVIAIACHNERKAAMPPKTHNPRKYQNALLFGPVLALVAAVLVSLWLAGCGFNPTEGDYGPVEWVPEKDSCWVFVQVTEHRKERVRGLCEGKGHDLEIMGRQW